MIGIELAAVQNGGSARVLRSLLIIHCGTVGTVLPFPVKPMLGRTGGPAGLDEVVGGVVHWADNGADYPDVSVANDIRGSQRPPAPGDVRRRPAIFAAARADVRRH